MRTPLAVFILFLFVSVANAQIDPGMQAAQQAAQTMDAMQQAMQANQQAMEASQRAAMDSMNLANQSVQPTYVRVATPKFSLKPGKLSAPASVRITDSTRGAIIYYTTDG
jgi:Na+-transporting NADH:ubiquinone oxidoreductase subunit NqrC